ncbi:MAG TPA: CBS domain-containing protein [Gemmatimonadaceae bacterium]
MTRVRDIMTKDVITIGPDLSIRDAMSLLSTRHISGAPVVAGGDIVGVITSTDLMAFAAELPGAPAELEDEAEFGEVAARDDMPEPELEPAGAFFTDLWEDAGADTAVRFAGVAGPEWNVLDAHTVEEAMTRAPIFKLAGDTLLPAAADFMREHGVHRMLVTDAGGLVGIVTATDVANAVADHKLREVAYVFGDKARFPRLDPRKAPHPEVTLGSHLERPDDAKKDS